MIIEKGRKDIKIQKISPYLSKVPISKLESRKIDFFGHKERCVNGIHLCPKTTREKGKIQPRSAQYPQLDEREQ
jgi:hypothetical protein